MKTLLLTSFLIISSPAAADEVSENCYVIGGLAEAIMDARLNDIPMYKVMEIFDDPAMPPEAVDVGRGMTILAYQSPAYTTDGAKERAIVEFRNKAEVTCHKALR